MKKRMVALVLCGVLIFAGNTEIFAADVAPEETTDISSRMDYINRAIANLQINSSGKAELYCYVKGCSGITRIEISAKLQKYVDGKWVTLETFTKNSNSNTASLNDSYQVSKGYTYRVRATVHAYGDSSSETRTVLGNEVKY